MRSSLASLAVLTVVLAQVGVAVPGAVRADLVAGAGVAVEPVPDPPDWRQLLLQAESAAAELAYQATMQLIQIDVDGPYVTEFDVVRDADGGLQFGAPERWLVGRSATEGFFVDEAGTTSSLHLVATDVPGVDLELLEDRYLVEVVGRAHLRTGPALAVTFTAADAMTPSERIFVNETTSLVVRRETYDVDGDPVRVVAMRDLVVDTPMVVAPPAADVAAKVQLDLSAPGIALLDDAGWVVHEELGQGFRLAAATAMEDDSGAVQLVYTDGLYRLSVYEQVGALAPDAMDGAVLHRHDGHVVHRWPGAEPERVVWTGDGHTFTAVSDLPVGRLMTVIRPLPADEPTSLGPRLRRGLERIGRWLWPFDEGDT